MSFYYPLGLLGLIGVPILIIIYIIKSKYTEQTIASTYLWDLSEKFLKKRKPISKLTGIITLILQILAVIAASLLIAHPVFTMPASANDYYFILDGSASMNMTNGSSTRFDSAKKQINSVIDSSLGGSSYTLIFASDATSVSFEGVTDKTQAKAYIAALEAGWNSADCSSAMTIVQEYFDINPSAEVYLVTDKAYTTENMTLIDVSQNEENYAFDSYGYYIESGVGVTANGTVVSYSSDASLTVELLLAQTPGNFLSVATTTVQAKAGEPTEFKVKSEITTFVSLELRITNNDALADDNVVILYDEAKTQQRKVLLVNGSDDGAYLKNALSGSGKASVTVVSSSGYENSEFGGYGMYVFNSYAPKTLPKNSAIWLVNAVNGENIAGSGITYRDTRVPRDESGPNSYYVPTYTKNTSAQAKLLTQGLIKGTVAVRQYARCGVPKNFTTVMDVGGDPLVCTGLNENNDREVVFTFKIGDSSFGMSPDFLILVKNLMNYSFPSAIEETIYNCGDVMNVNVVPGCEDIIITTPSQKTTVLDVNDTDICEVQLNETGTYTVTVKISGSAEETVLYAFAGVPKTESAPAEGGELILSGEKEHEYSDGYYDKLLAFFIIIALMLLADWGIYCYEQYQLR